MSHGSSRNWYMRSDPPYMPLIHGLADYLKAYHNLMRYARVLLANCPREATQFFVDYYTGQYRPRTQVEVTSDEPQAQTGGALQSLAALLPLSYMKVGGRPRTEAVEATEPAEEPAIPPGPDYTVPKPRTAFSAFVDHPREFVVFLEALVKKDDLRDDDKGDLFTALFEMYLDTANRQKDPAEKATWETKAKNLIEGTNVGADGQSMLIILD